MFGFFKKKIDKEQVLNKGLFLFHFENIFDGANINTKNRSLEEKMLLFSVTLASLVAENAIGEETELKVSGSYERAALIIIFTQAVLTISEYIKITNRETLSDVLGSGITRLICTDINNPTPQEHADMALATMSHKMLCQNHQNAMLMINENVLEWLYHRKDEHINNLTGAWHKIVGTLATQS